MKHYIFILILIVFTPICLQGQDKQLSLYDAVLGQWNNLYPSNMRKLKWREGTNQYSYIKEGNIKVGNPEGEERVLVTSEQITELLHNAELPKIKSLQSYKWLHKDLIRFNVENYIVGYSVTKDTIKFDIKYDSSAENKNFCYAAKAVAYTLNNNLYIANTEKTKIQVTSNTDADIISGKTVSRSEFNIDKGTFWSPKGNYLAFYQKDVSDVDEFPSMDITKRVAEYTPFKYPMAGTESEHVSLGIYNPDSPKITYIEKDSTSEDYLTNIKWGPEEDFIYISVLNRGQDTMQMNKYRRKSGKIDQTLFTQTNKKYVEPYHKPVFHQSIPEKFIYQTEQVTGYSHLFLYNIKGERIKQITKGEWVVTDFHGIDKQGKNLFITATKESPAERHAYKINIETTEMTRLTEEPGYHKLRLSDNGNYLLNTYSSTQTPRKINVLDTGGDVIKNLHKASNPVKDYKLGEVKISTLKAADNETELYYRLIKPADFKKDKKYPVVVYVYGGPHAQLVTNSWLGGARLWQYYMAQNGYVVLTVDNRGSENRGFAYESIIHRQCGQKEMKDQIEGIKLLKNKSFVDTNRIGVYGWSYGGFMSLSLKINYPEIFETAIAGGPVTNWKFYEIMYGERYMDTPQQNPSGYKNTSLLNKANQLQENTLVIHGGVDPTVVIQHSMRFVRECIKAGKQIDYFIYPRSKHNVRGNHRLHLMKKITDYFDENLK